MQGGIGILVLGGLFVVTLLKSLWKLINTDWDQEKFNGSTVLSVLMWPIVSLILLIVFIAYILPHLDS